MAKAIRVRGLRWQAGRLRHKGKTAGLGKLTALR
jgi:hypothetical protein